MFGKRAIAPLILILFGMILFVLNLVELNRGKDTLYGALSNLLIMAAMVLVIIGNGKNPNKLD